MNNRIKQFMVAFTILGLLVSIYMTIFKITSNEKMCVGSKDCSVVNASRYSEVNNIPVAVIGMFGYSSMLALHWLERKKGFFEDNGPMLIFGLAMIGFFFTLWLVYVEIALIQAYCPFCITSQISMTIIFFLSLVRVVRQN